MASEEAYERIETLLLHQQQVDAGLIPEDSPPLFTLPQPQGRNGRPWFFPDDWNPSEEAIAEFSKPPPRGDELPR
jgi:hypothetical protein